MLHEGKLVYSFALADSEQSEVYLLTWTKHEITPYSLFNKSKKVLFKLTTHLLFILC